MRRRFGKWCDEKKINENDYSKKQHLAQNVSNAQKSTQNRMNLLQSKIDQLRDF